LLTLSARGAGASVAMREVTAVMAAVMVAVVDSNRT
jgi:hypothetical protein